MERQQLRERLAELHAELEQTDSVGADSRELLRDVMDEIRGVLERAGDEPHGADQHESLLERLRESAREFEESHPRLATTVGRVVDALASMGI